MLISGESWCVGMKAGVPREIIGGAGFKGREEADSWGRGGGQVKRRRWGAEVIEEQRGNRFVVADEERTGAQGGGQ